MSLLALKFEGALAGYLRAEIPGFSVYEGHGTDAMEDLPRLVVSVTSGGGGLLRDAGVDELSVEILGLISAADIDGDTSPALTLARATDAVRELLSLDNLSTVIEALQLTPGLLVTGVEYNGHKEGRDPEKAHMGVMLEFSAWAGLAEI
ncbi:MAG: hypothetical protein FGM22_08285 [Burkholderiaceae bacterium]|nr:hypothetical protein [Burkholderiaceae bacterium]